MENVPWRSEALMGSLHVYRFGRRHQQTPGIVHDHESEEELPNWMVVLQESLEVNHHHFFHFQEYNFLLKVRYLHMDLDGMSDHVHLWLFGLLWH